jgi:heme iron utilization protein
LLSSLAEHTANLKADGRASLLVAGALGPSGDALRGSRVTLLGPCATVDEGLDEAKAIYLETHPYARLYAGFADFAFYRLTPIALRIVAGFGRIANVDAAAYGAAEPDPLAGESAALVARLNAERTSEIRTIVRARSSEGEAPASVSVTGVDRYGIDLAVAGEGGARSARVAFDAPLASAEAVLAAVEAMAGVEGAS